MSSNQPLKLPQGYYVVKGPKGHAVYSDASLLEPPLLEPPLLEPQPDAPDAVLVRVTPWRTTRHAAVTYFALNRLGVKNIHSEP